MYSNPYSNPYTPYSQTKIVHVNGENGARTFQMSPNSDVLLLDDTAPIVWLAQTDGAGYKTITPYKIERYVPEPPIDVKSLEDRIKRMEDMLNAKSNVTTTKQDKSNVWKSADNKTNDGHH